MGSAPWGRPYSVHCYSGRLLAPPADISFGQVMSKGCVPEAGLIALAELRHFNHLDYRAVE